MRQAYDTMPPWRGAQALGMGLRGRAAFAGGAARRGGVPDRSARLRVARSRGAGAAVGGLAARAPAAPARRRSGRSAPPSDYERALHGYGRSYVDVVRAFRGRFDHPPDVVARPRDEDELEATLDWALSAGAAVIPFGGGTSVVGGVEAAGCEGYAGRRDDRPQGARPRARGRPGVAVGADPGRRHRAADSRSSSASTGSRCATSPSRFSSRRSADGSPRAPAATSRRSTRTSTTSSSRCGR